jgi:hypothetical protein
MFEASDSNAATRPMRSSWEIAALRDGPLGIPPLAELDRRKVYGSQP